MEKKRFSVLIPDVDTGQGLPVAYCLNVSGQASVQGFSQLKSRPLQFSRLLCTFECAGRELEPSAWLTRIDEIVARGQVDVVLPVSNFAIRTLSEHRQTLSCAPRLAPLPDPHVFDVATNKALLANFLAAQKISHPETVVLTVGGPRPHGLSILKFPVLAKPPLSRGGAGIRRFDDPKELDTFLAAQREGEVWVVQEFIRGADLSVNVLCKDGQIVASTVQHVIRRSAIPYEPAAGVELRDDSAAMEVARILMAKLNWSGIANIDMRLDPQRELPLVLEVNGRYWLSLLGSLNAGVNFPLLACEIATGLPTSNRRTREARYFGSKGSIALSLIGGGQYCIRPSETNLSYVLSDPAPLATVLMGKAIKSLRTVLSGSPVGCGPTKQVMLP